MQNDPGPLETAVSWTVRVVALAALIGWVGSRAWAIADALVMAIETVIGRILYGKEKETD